MKIIDCRKVGVKKALGEILAQRSAPGDVSKSVAEIIERVKNEGDDALFDYSRRFDGVELKKLQVSEEEIGFAMKKLLPKELNALKFALKSIEKFHKKCLVREQFPTETVPGVKVWREFRPIQKVGLYVPGGLAAYPSTVLMLAGPARIAGCNEIIMCTPCNKDGECNPYALAAAKLCGVEKIFKVGGAQAIAAMAFGTESVPKVYKIFGPGNQYVSTAKTMLQSQIAIDMPAGPSEILIAADETANPDWIAADALSQLEHGADSQSIFVTFSREMAEKVLKKALEQAENLSRKNLIEKSLIKSFIVIVKTIDDAAKLIDEYAPEHLEIVTKNPKDLLSKVGNFGSAFLGSYSCEPLGDYATGSNHTLPTNGFAKMFSPLSIESFGKMVQIQSVSKKGFYFLAESVETLAQMEGLSAHKNSVTIRK